MLKVAQKVILITKDNIVDLAKRYDLPLTARVHGNNAIGNYLLDGHGLRVISPKWMMRNYTLVGRKHVSGWIEVKDKTRRVSRAR